MEDYSLRIGLRAHILALYVFLVACGVGATKRGFHMRSQPFFYYKPRGHFNYSIPFLSCFWTLNTQLIMCQLALASCNSIGPVSFVLNNPRKILRSSRNVNLDSTLLKLPKSCKFLFINRQTNNFLPQNPVLDYKFKNRNSPCILLTIIWGVCVHHIIWDFESCLCLSSHSKACVCQRLNLHKLHQSDHSIYMGDLHGW